MNIKERTRNSFADYRTDSRYVSKAHFQQGFSLLEILVAFSILALSLGVLLNIFSGGVRRAAISEEYQQAITIAESKLATAGVEVELQEGEMQGVIEDKYNWYLTAQLFSDEEQGLEADTLPVEPYQVTVTVEWEAGKEHRQVELTTLRLTGKKDES